VTTKVFFGRRNHSQACRLQLQQFASFAFFVADRGTGHKKINTEHRTLKCYGNLVVFANTVDSVVSSACFSQCKQCRSLVSGCLLEVSEDGSATKEVFLEPQGEERQ